MQVIEKRKRQLADLVDPNRPRDILADAKCFFKTDYPHESFRLVAHAYLLTDKLYEGLYPGFQACAVEYHNFAHSMAVFAASSRLLDGCALDGLDMSPEGATRTLIAALLHDSGYIREKGDLAGTGAQYTKVHVDRSAEFARREAAAFGLGAEEAESVARMILGTDIARNWAELAFENEEERLGAEILASADLLGQMSDRAYLEKLLFLYHEFREAGIGGYETAFDILRKTAGFYAATKERLDVELGRVSGKARAHFAARYGVDRDLYREAIEHEMAYLDSIIADDTSNFRTKLKRLDLGAVEG